MAFIKKQRGPKKRKIRSSRMIKKMGRYLISKVVGNTPLSRLISDIWYVQEWTRIQV